MKIQRLFKLNIRLLFFRFSPALLRTLRDQNKRMVLWSLMTNDFKWSADKVIDHLTKSVRGGDVVVFHDSEKAEGVVVKVLPEFISHCREKGFRFAKLEDKMTARKLT